jgi:DNA-directed RNA polymerase specialized sigma24 family protein
VNQSAKVDRDVFPGTRRTWLGERMADGHAGRAEALRHVMSVYAVPLSVYYRGSSFRRLGDALDWVHAFFVERVARPSYLEQWLESGERLRRWLTLGFCFFLKDGYEKERLRSGFEPLDPALPSPEPGPMQAFERAYVCRLADLALAFGEARCRSENMEQHWAIFREHRHEGVPYRDIGARLGIDPVRAATMARTAAKRFRQALEELLLRDGLPRESLAMAMQELLEVV